MDMNNYKKQVDRGHYKFGQYYYPGRWMSYWHETSEILSRSEVKSVLDVGPGSDLLRNILKTFEPELRYESVDIASDVQPDHIGSITNLPLESDSFDIVCAFQVLEHIKYEDVESAIVELQRVSKKYILISVPHFGPSFELLVKIPFFRRLKFSIKIPFPKTHIFAGQHYWELGKKGFTHRRFKRLLERHVTLLSHYVPFDNQYHHFYILEVKT